MDRKKALKLLFGIYCAVMLALLFWRTPEQGPGTYWDKVLGLLNPRPYETIRHFIRLLSHRSPTFALLAAANLFGNILMFVPLGLFLPSFWPRLARWWKTLLVSAGIIIAVEVTQMLTLLGYCDIGDLTLNLLGTAMGYCLFLIITKMKGSAAK
ncbi:MAG: VanZ family protein [Clostridia bacterium]|nr:VanZ family protein [Clostridia bacterium]